MKSLCSVRELREYCDVHNFTKAVFFSSNQPWFRTSEPCSVQATFQNIIVLENPALVCLKSGENTIVFDRVKAAEIEDTVLGTLITLLCGQTGQRRVHKKYRIILE